MLVDVRRNSGQFDRDGLIQNTAKLTQGLTILDIPILFTEQNPKGLGATVPEVRQLLGDRKPITKLSFSSCGKKSSLVS